MNLSLFRLSLHLPSEERDLQIGFKMVKDRFIIGMERSLELVMGRGKEKD